MLRYFDSLKMINGNGIDILRLKKKAVNSVIVLGGRRVVWQLIQTVSNVILARILYPNDFGIYALILFYINIFTLIADIGLFASLIQREKQPTIYELRCIFTVHLALGLLAAILMWFFSPVYLYFYRFRLTLDSYRLLILSGLVPLLFNLRIIPSALMERNLEFKKLTLVELIELIMQNASTVLLVLSGRGVESLLLGLIIGRFFAAFIFYLIRPWEIGLGFSRKILDSYIKFGLHFQVNTVIGTIGGSIAPLVVGGLSGTHDLGLVVWAGGVGALPRINGEIVGRIIFSAGARIQKDVKLFKKAIERVMEFSVVVTFPLVAIMLALARPITYIVFTGKWIEGITALYFFTLQSSLVIFWSLFTNALLALGLSKEVKNSNFLWIVIQWLLTIPLVKTFGFIGFPAAMLVSSAAIIFPFRELKKRIGISFFSIISPYIYFSVLTGLLTYAYSKLFPIASLLELIFSCLFGLIIYGLLLLLFQRKLILNEIAKVYNLLTNS